MAEDIQRLSAELQRFAALPEMQQRLQALGQEARASTPEALDRLNRADFRLWGEIITRANIRIG